MNCWTYRWNHGWMDGWMNGCTKRGWLGGQMDGLMDGYKGQVYTLKDSCQYIINSTHSDITDHEDKDGVKRKKKL